MGVLPHHHDKAHDSDKLEEHHSIASLRSKFESLAHGNSGLHVNTGPRAASRLPLSPGALSPRTGTPPPSDVAAPPRSPSRPRSPAAISTVQSSGVPSASSSTGSLSALSDAVRRPPPSSYRPPPTSFVSQPPPTPPKPAPTASNSLEAAPVTTHSPSPSSSLTSLPNPLRGGTAAGPPETDRATEPPSLEPRKPPLPTVNVRHTSLEVDPQRTAEADPDDEAPKSVSALRSRFGPSAFTSDSSAKRPFIRAGPSPDAGPSKSNLAAGPGSETPTQASSLPVSTEMPSYEAPAPSTPLKTSPPPVPVKKHHSKVADVISSVLHKGPAPPRPRSHSRSRPSSRSASPTPEFAVTVKQLASPRPASPVYGTAPKFTLTADQLAVASPTSMLPGSSGRPPAPPIPSAVASPMPITSPIPASGRDPAPPVPLSTSPQPLSHEPDSLDPPLSSLPRTESPRPTTMSTTSRRPAPPRPISPSPEPVVEVTEATPEIPAAQPPVKPPLPVRKATLPVGIIDAPPPIKSNRPVPTKSATLLSTSSSDSGLAGAKPPLPGNKPAAPTVLPSGDQRPALPQRPRGESLTSASVPLAAGGTGALPPRRPPARQATVHSVPTYSSSPPSGPRTRGMSISAADTGFVPPPPPPLRSAGATGLGRSNTVSAGAHLAGAGLGRASTMSAATRLEVKRTNGGASSPGRLTPGLDSDEEEEGPAPTLSSNAQRLLDEHPDSTYANKRPPRYKPDVNIVVPNSITAFAVYGRYACIAHTHVKVFDTQMDNTPILLVDQKDTGLDLRVKDPRVTALGFRPARSPACQGRYLWCGNKDGHLWEIDIQTGAITATKASAHASAVTYIMRHDHYALTLDDTGKLHVWDVPEAGEKSEAGNFRLFRTMRVSDRVTFAKMIGGRLWTATAPAVRSTTNTAGGVRGPTVRVYEPFAPGNAPPPRTSLTSEWTGSATSATVVPLKSDMVYIGHEGGFVSLWRLVDTEVGTELQCVQVLKVSTTDILALEGVGDHLWAGNRRGQIHVWNIEQQPWSTSNMWTAHADQPIHALYLDCYSIAQEGRLTLWSCSRDSLHGWDGLRSVNWIDKRMVERQPDYCDFRTVHVLVVSWNIDSAKPTDLSSGGINNTNFLDQVLGSVESPDIIVFGFQEVVPLTDKKLTAKTLLFGSKGRDGGGATNERVSGAYRAWADKLSSAVRRTSAGPGGYVKVQSEQLVGLWSCMFVKADERDNLRDVTITTVKRGIGGIYGNKGAIVQRMVMDDTSMCFINVHLAAGQRHKAARNADLAAIMEDKAVFPAVDKLPYVHGGDGTGILDHEMVVLNGDLNYRIDQRREVVETSIRNGDLAYLLEYDQLHREMRGNHAFRLRTFAEAPIHFAPTYKYDPGTDEYDSSEKRRIPAWCDRILFTKTPRITPLSYRRYEINVSDHRPVSAGLAFQVKRIDNDRMIAVYREVQGLWATFAKERLKIMVETYSKLC